MLLNCVDLEYFKFQGKRTTADLFQLFAMGDDMQNTIPRMALDFWYVILCFVVLSVIFVWGYNKIKLKVAPVNDQKLIQWILILPVIFITGIGFGRHTIQTTGNSCCRKAHYSLPWFH
ncbi:MAG: hypothetical protein IPL22_10780 [Bacteroidetes bacterium]|nr:hypothetical protein [Bacteroidota bacterium]